MKPKDIARSAWNSLKQRKMRTFLTSLGVMIGCTSIVVMVSIGIALTASINDMMSQMGRLTSVQIYGKSDGTPMEKKDLTSLEAIPGVKSAAGVSSISYEYPVEVSAGNGRYVTDYANIVGVDSDKLDTIGYKTVEGSSSLAKTSTAIPVLAGRNFAWVFADKYRPEAEQFKERFTFDENGNWVESDEGPWFDLLGQDLVLALHDPNDPEGLPYEVTVRPVGLLEENYQIGQETEQGFVMRDEDLKAIMQEASRQFGTALPKSSYSMIFVEATNTDTVDTIEKTLDADGWQYSSAKSMRESMEQESATVQLILGGLGGVSLFVAAIGIANTMVMSVSERTREIGIMKALGCRTKDIRTLFLTEAGMIGLIGGVAGLILSWLISAGINTFVWMQTSPDMELLPFLFSGAGRGSIIPLWLCVFALIFSAGVGIVSGFAPANRSVKISALEAIRRE